jgi:hypothetical protein
LDVPLENHVIVIPGLGNNIDRHVWATKNWIKFGLIPHVFDTRWRTEEKGFDEKLERVIKLVDSLSGTKISVIGNSAGSSLGLNILGERKRQISHLVINCGRVRDGDWPWFTFDQATASSPSFRESVIKTQELEKTLTDNDRKKILTLRPLFDEVVPPSTVPIRGANNEVIFFIEHSLSIVLNMTLFRQKIFDFIL